ncbi:MAG: hypothetical protein PW788_03070 [Micavibrio sp.]|nr:hypothetical protein [Micavibrio sp.]
MRNDIPTSPEALSRQQILQHLKARVVRRYMPRLAMSGIMLVVLGVIFLSSALLLWRGLDLMWLRYFIADIIGYITFLALLWCWTHFEGDGGGLDIPTFGNDSTGGGHVLPGSGAADGASALDAFGALEAWPLLLLALLAAAIGFVIAYNVWLAPEMLAELMLDAGLTGLLSKRAKQITPDGFLRSALRLTLPVFTGFTLVMMTVGFIINLKVPEAHSLAQAIDMLAKIRH